MAANLYFTEFLPLTLIFIELGILFQNYESQKKHCWVELKHSLWDQADGQGF